jgi:ketosteroid isomerase-like protein
MANRSDLQSIEAIQERLRAKSKAYYNRNFDAVMDVYLQREDICIFDPPIIYYGYAATAKMIRDFIDGSVGPMRIEYRSPEVRASGDLACSWQVAYIDTDLKNGQNVKVLCRMTDAWQRVDGKWYVVHEHNSLPLDHTAATELLSLTNETMSGISRD